MMDTPHCSCGKGGATLCKYQWEDRRNIQKQHIYSPPLSDSERTSLTLILTLLHSCLFVSLAGLWPITEDFVDCGLGLQIPQQ